MEDRLNRILAAWVEGVRRRARGVLVATAVSSVLLLGYAVTHLGVNTHHTAILSDSLPFWKDYNAFAKVFPILDEALLVVVDADTSEGARDAARSLAERLRQDPALYPDVYIPGGDDFFERNALLYLSVRDLQDLSDQMAAVQPLLAEVAKDRSLQNMATVLTSGIERLRTDPHANVDFTLVFDSLSTAAKAVLEGNPQPISWTEMILRRKLPGDSARRVLVVQPSYDFDSLLPGRRAIEGVRAAARELSLTPDHGVRVRITGNVALNTEEMVTVARNAVFGALASFVAVGLLLWLAMRSAHMVAATLLTLLVSLIATAAFAAAAVGHVNVVSVAFAVFIIGLGVDFGIHFGMRYAELRRADEDNRSALLDSTTSVGGSLALCACTTAIGFYVFVPTDYKAVGELGLISGTGMLISLFCTLTVLPALLTAWRNRPPGTSWPGALWFDRVVITASAHHPRTVRWVALLLALLSGLALPHVRFDHNVAKMRDPSTESVQTFEELLRDSDTSPWTIDVMEPSLDAAEAMAARLRKLDVVERAVTLRDYVPSQQDQKMKVLEDLGYFVPPPPAREVPPSDVPLDVQIQTLRALETALRSPWLAKGDPGRAAAATRAADNLGRFLKRLESVGRPERRDQLARFEQSLTGALPAQMRRLWRALDPQRIDLASLPASLRSRMLAPDGRARIEVLPRGDLSDNAVHARFVDTVKEVAPNATGSAVTILEFGRAVVRSFREALTLAALAVALLLWVLWRRLGDMVLVMAPLALAALLTAATAVLLDIPFNFANIVVLPLLLGVGVDSGIHLVHRHRVTIETTGHARPAERELLETSTAQAVFFSALTTMASFGSLAFSGHVGFASMGKLLVVGITYTLLANLIVLPALIEARGTSESSAGGAGTAAPG